MITQFYCNECGQFFVQSVEGGTYARCPACMQPYEKDGKLTTSLVKGTNVRIITDYKWRLETDDGLTRLPLYLEETDKENCLGAGGINRLIVRHRNIYGFVPSYLCCNRKFYNSYGGAIFSEDENGIVYRGFGEPRLPVKLID